MASSYGSGRTYQQHSYTQDPPVSKVQSVSLNDLNVNTNPNVVATSENSSGKTLKFKLDMTTGDPKVSPVIDLQRVSVIALENVIDNSNATQHITTPVIIDELSEGLKIIFAANRARGAGFKVYAKTSLDENEFAEAGWSLIEIDTPMPTDENPDIFRDYEYTLDADPFTVFQVMIVMTSDNSSKSPMITDLRALSLITASGLQKFGTPVDLDLNPAPAPEPSPEPEPQPEPEPEPEPEPQPGFS